MEVVRGLISGTGALFGGVRPRRGIEVMEQVTGRPCVWATAQYLSYARPPSVLELDVHEVVRGHQIEPGARASRTSATGDPHGLAALGRAAARRFDGQWADPSRRRRRPTTARPRPLHAHHEGTISDRLEMRLADARPS